MVKLGLIGFSPENGHPYSFSAIINGYNEKEVRKSNWPRILKYLSESDASDIGTLNASITHVWTQDNNISTQISESCYIKNISKSYTDMLGHVDAVLIARDDHERHMEMSLPFLESGTPVFIDKPLTLDLQELKKFYKYLKSGLLMTCSGFRFAEELDILRKEKKIIDNAKLINAVVVNDWEKYGIHMIDALLGVKSYMPISVEFRKFQAIETYSIEMFSGETFMVHCLGKKVPTFSLSFFGSGGSKNFFLTNNFIAFRRMLESFIKQVKSGVSQVDVDSTLTSIKILIAGQISKKIGKKYFIEDLEFNEIDS